MSKATAHTEAPRLRTPDDVAQAAIERFTRATAEGEPVDASAWKRAIAAEARVFAQEIIQNAGQAVVAGRVVGKREASKIAKDLADKLAGAAG